MEVLLYNELDDSKVKKQVTKTIQYLKAGDFKSADVKKMANTNYYRAKLDDTNRLLFRLVKYQGTVYILVVEVILNHDYDKSRFLNGATVHENQFTPFQLNDVKAEEDIQTIQYVNSKRNKFHILDKFLSFDEMQEEIYAQPYPLIIIGSAGSGKTALTLEKLKTIKGNILYTTLSAFLVENSRNLYYSFEYNNEHQEVDFLSFYEFLSSIEVPTGKELTFKVFEQWIWRYKQAYKIKDAYKVFEEFKGVLTGYAIDKPFLSKDEYLNLGIKQSIFPEAERANIYELFVKYLDFLKEGNYFDSNIVAYEYLNLVNKKYDFVVIDEVQDITNIQLFLIINSLHNPTHFILCGDSNQIVHPNFFSWSHIKSLFYNNELKGNIMRVLMTNYRNTPEVTEIANQLLRIKNTRFGSIDKESTYLVESVSKHKGEVQFIENVLKVRQDLNQKTRRSTKFAIVVMREEDKAEVRKYFATPLLFSIHEVKGLEYENIILFNIISSYEREFRELVSGVDELDLQEKLVYNRAKDKSDKSLDEYKFYVNSLYVAITRAVNNLYILETNKKHALLELLGLTNFSTQLNVQEQSSSNEEWQQEANRLELQGKQEQADAIRKEILQIQQVPWEVITRQKLEKLKRDALNPDVFNKKAKDQFYEYSLFYDQIEHFEQLAELKYRPAERWQTEGQSIIGRKFAEFKQDNLKQLLPKLNKYGLDYCNEFNITPIMTALLFGAEKIITYLQQNGAKTTHKDNFGRNALQLSLLKCFKENNYKLTQFTKIYPQLTTDSLKLKIGKQLVKLDKHQAEYLILNYMIAVYPTLIAQFPITLDPKYIPFFQSASFIDFYDGLGHHILPEYRRKRAYISSILAKNEYYRNDKYNKKLFLRVKQGHYIPNPAIQIEIEEQWIYFYDLVTLSNFEKQPIPFFLAYVSYLRKFRLQIERGELQDTPDEMIENSRSLD